MGRNAQPVALIKSNGRSNHLTKAEIARREASEIKLGEKDLVKLKVPQFVKDDINAFKHWKQHIKEYKDAAKHGVEVITTADVGQLALYCKTFSEYERLLKIKQKIERMGDVEDEILDSEEIETLTKTVQNQINFILSVDGLLKLETAINKKMDMLIKMQDRLFLNPLARIKNVPKRESKKAMNPMDDFI